MAFAANGPVRLWFETLGPDEAPAVLMLNGAGKQAIDAPDGLCALIVERGFRVIRYDQRDTGQSTDFARAGASAAAVGAALADGRTPELAYNADDMAADAIAVLDAAEATRVHLFGRSLGAYIAQHVALLQPRRIRSITLAMAFSRGIGSAVTPERLAQLDAEHFDTADAFVQRTLTAARAVGNPNYYDEGLLTADARRAWDRGVHQGAAARHFAVGLAAEDIRPRLAALNLPVQVIAGALDRVILPALSEESASAFADAWLTLIDDMAHEGPPPLWARWTSLFLANAQRAI